ncbi:MAG: 2-dehydropantoate 2-reductase [Alphaproteobacteria bacterium]|nr:2-dehydropantoate 2-reductase [Alphaproteobacteria bacterium]
MRFAVMGAGAVGCYFGGLLARAGHDVTFIGRPDHVAAIAAHGLLLETKAFKAYVPARAASDVAAIENPDVVLFCVKSADTEAAGRALAPRLEPRTTVLSLQNGVDNAERLAAVIDREVIAAVVYVGTEMAGPGHVLHHGRGELAIGASAHSEALARTLSAAAIPTSVAPDIAAVLWSKLIINCAYNAISAVANLPYGEMVRVDGAAEFMTGVVRECTEVANACGVALPGDVVAKTLSVAATMPGQYSSTAQDLKRGKPTEIDFLNGYVVRKGAEFGIATPMNRALQVMVRLAERSRQMARG